MIQNPFVYETIVRRNLSMPTIPAQLVETFAQRYEDIILMSLLRAYVTRKSPNRTKFRFGYVEIGANHPVATSSTYLLHKNFGVSGYLVEPNPILAEELRKTRGMSDVIIEAAVVTDNTNFVDLYISPNTELSSLDSNFVDKVADKIRVPAIHINDLLRKVEFRYYDEYVLFIDCEGKDVEILEAMDHQHKPMIIQIEASEEKQPGNTKKIMDNMTVRGYKLVAQTEVNLIFMDSEKSSE